MITVSRHRIHVRTNPDLTAAVLERVTAPKKILFDGRQRFCGEVSGRTFRFYLRSQRNDAIYAKGSIESDGGTGSVISVGIRLSPYFFFVLSLSAAVYIQGLIPTWNVVWAVFFPFYLFVMFFLVRKEEKDTIREIADAVGGEEIPEKGKQDMKMTKTEDVSGAARSGQTAVWMDMGMDPVELVEDGKWEDLILYAEENTELLIQKALSGSEDDLAGTVRTGAISLNPLDKLLKPAGPEARALFSIGRLAGILYILSLKRDRELQEREAEMIAGQRLSAENRRNAEHAAERKEKTC